MFVTLEFFRRTCRASTQNKFFCSLAFSLGMKYKVLKGLAFSLYLEFFYQKNLKVKGKSDSFKLIHKFMFDGVWNISSLSSSWPPLWKLLQRKRISCRDCYYYHAHLCLSMDLTYGLSPLWLYECSHTNHFDRSAKQTGPWWWQYLWECHMHRLPTHWDVYSRKTCQKHLMFPSYWRDSQEKFHSGMWGEEEENFNQARSMKHMGNRNSLRSHNNSRLEDCWVLL